MDGSAVLTRPVTIAVLAIGGQGGGVLVDWIVALAESQGWLAQSTSVPGVAQRTGATIYYVETIAALPGQTPVFSAMAAPGDVDVVIAAEWMEAGRAIQRGLVTPDRTTLIASTHRTYAVSEKEGPGDGTADSGAVTRAAAAAARRFVAFDMAALADQAGSVVSSVLFGALCGSDALPFGRAAFEATVSAAGIGVQSSLRGFALGYDATRHPSDAHRSVVAASPESLKPVGYAPYDALLARAAALPAAAHAMLAEGLRHVVSFQDVAYGAAYLDAVEAVCRAGEVASRVAHDPAAAGAAPRPESWPGTPPALPPGLSRPSTTISAASQAVDGRDRPGRDTGTRVDDSSPVLHDRTQAALTIAAAKYIARAMAYDDVIRVAALKTQPNRADRVRSEMAAGATPIIATTEFMHPRMEEILGLLPPKLGHFLDRRVRLLAWLDKMVCGPRRIRTDTITGFLVLYLVAGLRFWRPRTLRYGQEWSRIDDWLSSVGDVATRDPALAVELLTNQRLIKGYSETHARGLDKYTRVMDAALRLRGHPDAAAWVRRLREAALKDEAGSALDAALKTVDSFLQEREAA